MSSDDYGEWWDRVAGSLEEALTTTYAISDQADYRIRGLHGDANTPGASQLFEMGRLHKASRVLEIGCGLARVGRELAPSVGEWHGADVSSRLLGFAAERLVDLENIHLHQLDGYDLRQVPALKFDFIYSTTTFAHLDKEDFFAYLLECARLLTAGGRLYVDTWNLDHPDSFRLWKDVQTQNRGRTKERGRYQCSTPPELTRYLNEAGFRVETLEEDRLLRAVARVEGLILHEPHDGLPPFGYVGSPENLQQVGDMLNVDGWALDDIERIEVRIAGGKVHRAELGWPRPDVAALFPRYPRAEKCGFKASIPCSDLPPGRHRIHVDAVDHCGVRRSLTGYHLSIERLQSALQGGYSQ